MLSERINALISHLGLSTRAFALQCGLRQNTLSNQLNGNREISLATVMAILSAYPNVSAEWLLRGTGDMFNSKEEKESERINLLLDTIATLQQTINEKSETIKELQNRLNG